MSRRLSDLEFSDYAREPRISPLWWIVPTLIFDAVIAYAIYKWLIAS